MSEGGVLSSAYVDEVEDFEVFGEFLMLACLVGGLGLLGVKGMGIGSCSLLLIALS